MTSVDIHDETFVAADPARLRATIVDGDLAGEWFPKLRRTVFMDRGTKGVRWSVAGEVDGSLEVWLEQVPSGTVVHWFVRGEPGPGTNARRVARRYVETLNARMFAVKDEVGPTPRSE